MGKGTNTTTQSQSTSPNPAAMAAYQNVLARAQDVGSLPYQAYGGELTAGINPQQQSGIGAINQNAGFASPYISEAAGYARQGAAPITAADIARYQDPFTQQVVDATQAQFNNQNAQAQSSLMGNAAARGALGGDRVGVAQANLAGQQSLAQSPVIAGLYSQGFNRALAAAQQQQQATSQAGYALGNLGVAGQQAGLAGANAMLGAGSLEQQTEQQRLSALYQQYQIGQAFPYQQTQWLAGLSSGVGSQMGSTSTGTKTEPPPNQAAQWAGAGLTAAGMFLSDRRAKDDIEQIGRTNDGLPIYRFRYAGRPETQIGLMADEVEQRHPEAVAGVHGTKFVDYRKATDDAVAGFAVGGAPGTPYADVQGYVPTMEMPAARGMPGMASMPSGGQQQGRDLSKLGSLAADVGSKLYDKFGNQPLSLGDWGGGQVGDVVPITWGPTAGMSGIYAAGGAVYTPGAYDDGGTVARFAPHRLDERFAPGEPSFAQRAQPMEDAISTGVAEPRGGTMPGFDKLPVTGDSIMLPRARPPEAQAAYDRSLVTPGGELPPAAAPTIDSAPQAAAPTAGFAPSPAAAPQAQQRSGFGLGWLSPAAQQGLMAAGLGMMASRSPHLGSAIGEGGLAGLHAYSTQKEHERSAEEKKVTQAQQQRRIDLEAERLAQAARDTSERIGISRETLAETKRQHESTPVKMGIDRYGQEFYGIRQNGKLVPIDPTTGLPRADMSVSNPSVVSQGASEEDLGVIPANAKLVQGGAFDYTQDAPHIEKGMDVPKPQPVAGKSSRSVQTDAEYHLQTGKLPPVRAGKSPVAIQQEQYRRAVQNYAGALAESRGMSPEQTAEMWRTSPGMLRFILGADGRSTVSLGTAVRHLDTINQLAKAWAANDTQMINRVRATISREFGSSAATNLESAAKIVGPEIIKALGVAGAGTEHDRTTAATQFSAIRSPEQLIGAVDTVQKLLGGQLEGRERQALNAGVSKERFKSLIGDRAYEVLTHAEAKPTSATSADKQALDWANANPNDPRAAAIKKRLGAQ